MNKHEADDVNPPVATTRRGATVSTRAQTGVRTLRYMILLHETDDLQRKRFIFSDGYLQRKTGLMR